MTPRAALQSLLRRCSFGALLLLALAVILILSDDALARAGGGQGYSGGRSSGGGGRSSGGGGGGGDSGGIIYLVFQLFRLCFVSPVIGIPILLTVVGFVVYAYSKGKDAHESSVIHKANAGRDLAVTPGIVAEIQQQDPQFDADALLGRVSAAFVKIQHAWSQQNLAEVRPFISDAVHERFSLQFDEQKTLGYRNRMENVAVQQATLANGRSDRLFDELDVRIAAEAVDQRVTLADGRVLDGSTAATPFVEVWSFLRRRGAKTLTDKLGLMEGNCPNCGAAIEMNQSANCQYCGAQLRSGEYDWVLVEITQECEWTPAERHELPGVAALQSRDAEFNPQELEDRASVIFWRRVTAARLASAEPLRKVALSEYCEAFDRGNSHTRGKRRTYMGECAVGSVDLLGVIPAGQGGDTATVDGFDRALVEVRWSGHVFTAEPDGRLTRGGESAVSQMLLVLARKATARSNPDKSVSSAHCPGCGAPETGGSSGACQFCGMVLNDGAATWALERETSVSDPQGQALIRTLQGAGAGDNGDADTSAGGLSIHGASPSMVLAWMVKMTVADGEVDPRERELLVATARRYGVPEQRLDDMISAAQANALDLPKPADRDEAQAHLQSMARVALADGKISSEEYTLLRTTGQQLGLSDYDVKQLLQRTKADMYAEAKTQIRSTRNGNGRSGWAQ
jgi:uncharacterized tellurite resistance protein B-like protein